LLKKRDRERGERISRHYIEYQYLFYRYIEYHPETCFLQYLLSSLAALGYSGMLAFAPRYMVFAMKEGPPSTGFFWSQGMLRKASVLFILPL